MTSSLTALATAHATAHSAIPSPLTILLVVAAVGYVLWSRMKGRPLKLKRVLVLPVILMVLGITDLTGSSAPHLTPKDIAFLVVSAAIAAVLGAARGATIELYPQQGELWQRYRRITVGLWIILIAIRLIVIVIASAVGASAGAGTSTLLLTLSVSLLAEAAIVGPRALSTGLPFATGHEDSGGGRSGRPRSRPSLTTPLLAMAPTREPPASRSVDEGVQAAGEGEHETAPSRNRAGQAGAGQWRSPSLSDGVRWLREGTGEPGNQDWSQEVPSPGPADGYDHHHDHHEHHDHHHNHHGLTGPS
jgi:hypothetical protein